MDPRKGVFSLNRPPLHSPATSYLGDWFRDLGSARSARAYKACLCCSLDMIWLPAPTCLGFPNWTARRATSGIAWAGLRRRCNRVSSGRGKCSRHRSIRPDFCELRRSERISVQNVPNRPACRSFVRSIRFPLGQPIQIRFGAQSSNCHIRCTRMPSQLDTKEAMDDVPNPDCLSHRNRNVQTKDRVWAS